MKILQALFFLVTFSLITSFSFGQKELYTNELSGVLSSGMQVTTADEKFDYMEMNPTTWEDEFKNLRVENRVSLFYDPTVPLTGVPAGNTQVTVDITWQDELFIVHTTQEILEVTYDPDGTIVMDDRATYLFSGGHVVDLEVVSVGGSLSAAAVILRSEIEVDRGYTYAGTPLTGVGIDAVSETEYITF